MSDHAGNHRSLVIAGDWPGPVPAEALPWLRPCRLCAKKIVIALVIYFAALTRRDDRPILCICPDCVKTLQGTLKEVN